MTIEETPSKKISKISDKSGEEIEKQNQVLSLLKNSNVSQTVDMRPV